MAKDLMEQRSPPWRGTRDERVEWLVARLEGRLTARERRVLRRFLQGWAPVSVAVENGGGVSIRRVRQIAEKAVLRLVHGRSVEERKTLAEEMRAVAVDVELMASRVERMMERADEAEARKRRRRRSNASFPCVDALGGGSRGEILRSMSSGAVEVPPRRKGDVTTRGGQE